MTKPTPKETFGSDVNCLAMLLHLASLLKGFKEGPFKVGFETAIEEAGAYLASLSGDGGDQAQTPLRPLTPEMSMTTFADYKDLPAAARLHLEQLEEFIGDMDGKTIGTPTNENTFIDDGTVDSEDAVKAFNGLVALLHSGHRDGAK